MVTTNLWFFCVPDDGINQLPAKYTRSLTLSFIISNDHQIKINVLNKELQSLFGKIPKRPRESQAEMDDRIKWVLFVCREEGKKQASKHWSEPESNRSPASVSRTHAPSICLLLSYYFNSQTNSKYSTLEFKRTTNSMALSDEKLILREIQSVQRTKSQLEEYNSYERKVQEKKVRIVVLFVVLFVGWQKIRSMNAFQALYVVIFS